MDMRANSTSMCARNASASAADALPAGPRAYTAAAHTPQGAHRAHQHQTRRQEHAVRRGGPETVLQAMSEGGYAKLTYLHQMHKTPVGPVWVNTAQVRFLNELG